MTKKVTIEQLAKDLGKLSRKELDDFKSWMENIEKRLAFLEQKYKHKK